MPRPSTMCRVCSAPESLSSVRRARAAASARGIRRRRATPTASWRRPTSSASASLARLCSSTRSFRLPRSACDRGSRTARYVHCDTAIIGKHGEKKANKKRGPPFPLARRACHYEMFLNGTLMTTAQRGCVYSDVLVIRFQGHAACSVQCLL